MVNDNPPEGGRYSGVPQFEFRICLVFRYSDFEFDLNVSITVFYEHYQAQSSAVKM
jgi:hypothetical protein